ncbi:MAG: DEAD/DEAH box helicase, partial [Nanoarchaeota archaeon]|nr:DEAD/DEAH box helicase [Nanoarchaeota archaeon]
MTKNEIIEDPKNKLLLFNLENGMYDSLKSFDLHNKSIELSAIDSFEKLVSLNNVKVDLYTHQIDTAYTIINKMKLGALLADEVGLGKTIEAGIVIKELILRGLVKRILILVPASLSSQWQDEMRVKFNEEFIRKEEFHGKDFWTRFDKIICSIDTAKQPENSEEIRSVDWDLILVDEAHKLKNEKTLNFKFVEKLPKKYFFMLTATPMQNNLKELYNMFTLLKPGLLGTYSQFQSRFMQDERTPSNHQELQSILKEVMIRNRRTDVDIKFPERIVKNISFKL